MSNRWWRIGSYIWTSCAAGWLVLGLVTRLPVCFIVCFACVLCSIGWNLMLDPEREGGHSQDE
jgi:hypothetical protein